jgi:hypothetical protein
MITEWIRKEWTRASKEEKIVIIVCATILIVVLIWKI